MTTTPPSSFEEESKIGLEQFNRTFHETEFGTIEAHYKSVEDFIRAEQLRMWEAAKAWSQCNNCFEREHCGKCECCLFVRQGFIAGIERAIESIPPKAMPINSMNPKLTRGSIGWNECIEQIRDALNQLKQENL